MSDEKLQPLLNQLNQKLIARLEAIEQECQSQMSSLEEESKKEFKAAADKMKENNTRHLAQLKSSALRDARMLRQESIWNCERDCINQTQVRCQQLLAQKTLDKQYLANWIKEAQVRLQQPEKKFLKLQLNASWLNSFAQKDIAVEVSPLLGGAILKDTARHIEIDGSWEQRMELLIPELWQRWKQVVSENNQN
ncbi:hypothetical protein [Psychromonas aquimarina]|uniref:hypothetical protein n=1 Tax=Psychromonas aquimarina TaxID=444919 RepID=UPI0003FBFE2F|nr:hypothetical protein [Psychromonas aquimarina]